MLDDAMSDLMRALGEATGASRAYVFENVDAASGEPFSLRRAAWSADDDADDRRPAAGAPAPGAALPALGDACSLPARR